MKNKSQIIDSTKISDAPATSLKYHRDHVNYHLSEMCKHYCDATNIPKLSVLKLIKKLSAKLNNELT